ncbi:cubilin-like [Saccostrea cucullata]|uniref:cubilin-like n=1 Tax=Saccostrea cuccullata TaxID=36930 RepID=UPI002ED51CA4
MAGELDKDLNRCEFKGGVQFYQLYGSCGRNFSGDVGAFAITTSQNRNSPDTCIVRINVTEGKLAIIRFKTLIINCSSDFIEIRDGPNENSELIRRYCENSAFSVAATQNFMFIRFINGGNLRDLVVSAEYFVFDPVDAKLNASSGSFASPRYQGPASLQYPNNLRATISISVPGDFGIIFTFSEFDLEPAYNGKCLDYLEIQQADGRSLGEFCGNSIVVDIVSKFNTMYLHFVTNTNVVYPGFSFTWEVCGGVIDQAAGTMVLPTFNGYYRNNMDCTYVFRQPEGKRVAITFTQFNLQQRNADGKCMDYVQISDSGSTLPIAEHCGIISSPFTVTSTFNELSVRFYSDAYTQGTGISISYIQVEPCGGKYELLEGRFFPPVYSNLYSANENCDFHIQTYTGSKIMVAFSKFRLENNWAASCVDYLEIVDPFAFEHQTLSNGDPHDHVLENSHKHYCGATFPPNTLYHGNELFIKFRSDGTVETEGFVLEWAACGGKITDHYGEIKSPELYLAHAFDITCEYTIEPLDVESFFVQYKSEYTQSSACDNALKVEEIGPQNSTLLNLPCSNEGNGLLQTGAKKLKLTFNQALGRPRGFKYSLIWTACGSRVTTPTGKIRSPFWPGFYPIKRSCSYVIDSVSGSNVVLDFLNLNLVKTGTCEDYIQIHNGVDENSPLLRVVTGSTIPETTISTTSRMFVKFVAQCDVSSEGFQAKWSVCGVTLSEESGEIMSPSYPKNYIRDIVCSYTITQYPGRITSLTFIDFDVGSKVDGSCIDDYVEIRDGFFRQSTLLGKYCGKLQRFTINSTSNTLNLILVSSSNQNIRYGGFKATYKSNVKETMLTSTAASPNFTVIYKGLTADQQNLLDLDIALICTLSIIIVILIVVILVLLLLKRKNKPPLIVQEQKVEVSNSSRNDGVLNYRDNTQLLDIYNKVDSPSHQNKDDVKAEINLTLQQQLREQQRRKSTGSHVTRDVYAQPLRKPLQEKIQESTEFKATSPSSVASYKQTADNYAQMTETFKEDTFDLDNYAKVDPRAKSPVLKFSTSQKGYANDTYDDVESTRAKTSSEMMYL